MSPEVPDEESIIGYQLYSLPDCNLVNPVEYFKKTREVFNYHFMFNSMKALPQYADLGAQSRINISTRFKTLAKEQRKKELAEIIEMKLPEDIISLLNEKKKKVIQKLIKEIEFDSNILMALPIHAWLLHKMLYSRIVVDHHAKELEDKKFPWLIHKKEDGELDYIGPTNMSQVDMRIALEKRHRVIIDLIGDEVHWHCFFRTLSGIQGIEAQHVGQPHIHYISSAWGMSRKDVIENLTSYRYKLKTETIPFNKRSDS